jgi:superfamily II DNA or RNA helicase
VESLTITFDRGTLRVDGQRSIATLVDVRSVPLGVWDGRIGAWRVAAHRYAELVAACARAGLAVDDRVRPRDGPPVRDLVRPPLRSYQETAIRAWTALGRRGTIVLPTGAGKTRLALAILAELAVRTVVLVPTRALLLQWERELSAIYAGAVGVVGDGARRITSITAMTFESAYRWLDVLGDQFDLLVVDEVHHFAGGLRTEALEMCVAPWRLGLTATAPPRGSPEAARIEELVGPVVYALTVADLAGTHLAAYDTVPIETGLESDEADAYARLANPFLELRRAFRLAFPGADWPSLIHFVMHQPGGSGTIADFHRASAIAAYPRRKAAIVARLLERHRADKTLVFTARAEDAYAIAAAHLVPVITAETSHKERTEILSRFGQGVYRTIVSARVLNEGIDVPDARVAVVVSGALGGREHVQRVGRVLRPATGKRALVYDLITRGTVDEGRAYSRRRHLAAEATARI